MVLLNIPVQIPNRRAENGLLFLKMFGFTTK
jgi:hypothetical protein